MAHWAWKPANSTTLGLFQDTQANIDIAAREESKFLSALLGTTAYRGDFLGVEKNGTDLGCWKVISPPSVYATTLNWDDQGNGRWINFSKTLAQSVDLPLLGWQISIGHPGLPNIDNEYEDTFLPYFFDHVSEYLNGGFIGMLAGCANQDKGTVASIDVNAVGDKGWFYGKLSAFNSQRPYLSIVSTKANQIHKPAKETVFRIVKNTLLVNNEFSSQLVSLELIDCSGKAVHILPDPNLRCFFLGQLARGTYAAKITCKKAVYTTRLFHP